ncbi:PAS domain-containing sensor histidine kinase [Actinocorallia populi]|uniref:PAS domain-containing sensor histidine kinase n=1 Tax=Actinocorallia populi TaxID=2079200 RepID=UPI000D0947CB|nr:PAS domain-containing sensor histidine kinase [Actinocorallia populi]
MTEVDFESLFDSVPGPLALMSTDLVFLAANRAYERLLSRPREDLIGRYVFDVFPGGPSQEEVEALRSSLEKAASGEIDLMMLQRYDVEDPSAPGKFEERYWNVVHAPLLDSEGTVRGVIAQPQEVTSFVQRTDGGSLQPSASSTLTHLAAVEAHLFSQTNQLHEINQRLRDSQVQERQNSEALRQAVQQQREAVADTSHDLRGPLTGLQLRLQEALDDSEADPHEIMLTALRDAERLGDIVSDLLDLARLEAGSPAETRPVDLARLIRGELAQVTAKTTLATSLDPGIVVQGSPVRLGRLVNNLLANARRHARTRVEVSLRADGGQAVLEVRDDGPGIPDDEKEAVFRRFYRRSDAQRSDPDGTGLGLPISRQIAQAHGGTLHAADHPDGSPGARLILRLPLANRSLSAGRRPEREPPPGRRPPQAPRPPRRRLSRPAPFPAAGSRRAGMTGHSARSRRGSRRAAATAANRARAPRKAREPAGKPILELWAAAVYRVWAEASAAGTAAIRAAVPAWSRRSQSRAVTPT